MTDDEKEKHHQEYLMLLALFLSFMKNIGNDASRQEALYALAELRAELAIKHAVKGFGMTIGEALLLLKNYDDNSLTKEDKDKRDRLVAAIDNLIDFSVCQEYQVTQKAVKKYDADDNSDEIDFDDSESAQEYIDLCALYNETYAAVENADIEYAMVIANKWIHIAENEYLTYWTMNDTKVRPWHLELQGYTGRASEYPAWMIPPIEWHCRCFLITSSGDSVIGKSNDIRKVNGKIPKKPAQIDGVFSESVAKCGRIFSSSHPYFQVKDSDKEMLESFVSTIKAKYYG